MANSEDVDPSAPWNLPYSSRPIEVCSTFERQFGRRGRVTSVHVVCAFAWRETQYCRDFVCSPEDWEAYVVPLLHDAVDAAVIAKSA